MAVEGRHAGVAWHDVRRVHPGRRGRPDVVALDGLTLEGPPGELLVLVGPSGSGKSTALRALAGIEPLDAGSVHIDGADVTAVAAHERDVAMVFQDLALFPHMTVADNVLFGASLRRLPEAEQRTVLADVAEQLDLRDLLDRRPSELSGGQQQRVALARALVRKPAVFLLDEPLSNLDARLRLDARTRIVALQRRLGITMVHVTHDQTEAMTMGDRIAVLRDGRLEQVGTPREVYDEPATTFVASFLGMPPMNLLPGSVALAGTTPADTDTVGVRPEDLVFAEDGQLAGRVLQVEDLGSEVVVLVETEHGIVHVRRGVREPLPQEPAVTLALAPGGRIHRFDADGQRLSTVEGGPGARG